MVKLKSVLAPAGTLSEVIVCSTLLSMNNDTGKVLVTGGAVSFLSVAVIVMIPVARPTTVVGEAATLFILRLLTLYSGAGGVVLPEIAKSENWGVVAV